MSEVDPAATRCPHCTSMLTLAGEGADADA